MRNTRVGPKGELGIHSQESLTALEALAFVAQSPCEALTVLGERESNGGYAAALPLAQPHTAQSTAQASSFPPTKKARPAKPALQLILHKCPWRRRCRKQQDLSLPQDPGESKDAAPGNSQSLAAFEASGGGQQQ